MSTADSQTETLQLIAARLFPSQIAVLRSLSSEQGNSGISAALRRIIEDWARDRNYAAHLAADAPCVEDASALTTEAQGELMQVA
jgi:hypothetical protein